MAMQLIKSWRVLRSEKLFLAFLASYFLQYVSIGVFFVTSLSFVMQKTASTVAISTIIVFQMLPTMLLAPFAGVFFDNYDRIVARNICNILRALTILGVVALFYFSVNSYTIFVIATVVYYTLIYIQTPVEDAIVKDILTHKYYHSGTSALQFSCQFGSLLSGVLAGTLIVQFNIGVALIVAAMCEILSALILHNKSHLYPAMANHDSNGHSNTNQVPYFTRYLKDLKDGWHYVSRDRRIILLCTLSVLVLPFVVMINSLLAPLAFKQLSGDALTLGQLESIWGLGTLVSASVCLLLISNENSIYCLLVSMLSLVLLTSILGVYESEILVFFALGCSAFFYGNFKIASRAMLYDELNQAYSGRTMSLVTSLSLFIAIVFSLLIGVAADRDLSSSYYLLSIISLFGVILIVLLSRVDNATAQ